MGSLSDREVAILFEMELSLLASPHATGHLAARDVYVDERHRVTRFAWIAALGFVLLTATFTVSIAIALAGAAIMFASSLALAHSARIMRRASAMLRHPSTYE